jgi:hypothetical protein
MVSIPATSRELLGNSSGTPRELLGNFIFKLIISYKLITVVWDKSGFI